MTREEAIAYGKRVIDLGLNDETQAFCDMAIKALEQQPCKDAISRQAVIDACDQSINLFEAVDRIKELAPVTSKPKTGYCKDCKWWKDSDGAYRRGIGAESQCPMNRIEVYEGNGYCFMFEPQESEE